MPMPLERDNSAEVPDTIGAAGSDLESARPHLVKTAHPPSPMAARLRFRCSRRRWFN